MWSAVVKEKDDITDSDSAAIGADDHTWSLKMTYVPTSAPEGKEQAVALDKKRARSKAQPMLS